MNYVYQEAALSPDPNLAELSFDAGNFRALAGTPDGERLQHLLRSQAAALMIFGAVGAAPSRPPVVAIEHLLRRELGRAAFEPAMKQFTGRLVRQLIEHLGGSWVRGGVPVTVASEYTKGSIYDFGQRPRRKRGEPAPAAA